MKKVLVICGPTASGKTALAIECAKLLHTEVISADSMLIYRNCNIGTAKPTEEEKQGVVHHMIDIVDPTDEFSVSDYERKASPILDKLHTDGKIPVLCGGTGFYIKSLLYKSHFGGTAKDDSVRKKYEDILSDRGAAYLHNLLEKVDYESAKKIHQNDTKRVIRALEIYELTGKKKSEQTDKEEPIFNFLCFRYQYERDALYERINRRVDAMFRGGLMKEVEELISMGITDANQCMQGIGYKEVYSGIKNGSSVEEIKEKVKQSTRNYAKRQITFFNRMQNLVDLVPRSAAEDAQRILESL